jgi:hypothetical protein
MERIKNFYLIDILVRHEFKRFLCNDFVNNSSYISIKGVEVINDYDLNTDEEATAAMVLLRKPSNRSYPWAHVEEIICKRFTVTE